MKRTCSFLTIAFFIFAIGATAKAQILAWDTEGLRGDEALVASTTTNPNVITSGLFRGNGVLGANVQDTFCAEGFTTIPTLDAAIAAHSTSSFSATAA